MNLALVIAILAFGGIGGWIGWRNATKAIHRSNRSDPDDRLPGEHRHGRGHGHSQRQKINRLVSAGLHALVGVAIGLTLMGFLMLTGR